MEEKLMSEMVYVINSTSMEKMRGLIDNEFSGETWDIVGFNTALLEGFFMDRGSAENAPQFKQIIPYIVFMSEDGHYLVYQRTGSEERLSGNYSIGLGGHINPIDQEGCDFRTQMVWKNMARELKEEVNLGGLAVDDLLDNADLAGVLFSSENDVSRVHLGAVYKVPVKAEHKHRFSMKSEGKNLAWKSVSDLKALGDDLEAWSRILLGKIC
jgi:predicted NUDIX family phosphoesterase